MISSPIAIVIAVISINFWLILDCVDGNIARCRKKKQFMESLLMILADIIQLPLYI
ncbi:MAG: hypothetical protein ACLRMN_02555 [Mediterraneibacter gnavus]